MNRCDTCGRPTVSPNYDEEFYPDGPECEYPNGKHCKEYAAKVDARIEILLKDDNENPNE